MATVPVQDWCKSARPGAWPDQDWMATVPVQDWCKSERPAGLMS